MILVDQTLFLFHLREKFHFISNDFLVATSVVGLMFRRINFTGKKLSIQEEEK